MVHNGFERAKEFYPNVIAREWRDLLAGPVASGYEKWKKQSAIYKAIDRPVRYIYRSMKHKLARKWYWKNVRNGARPFPK